MFLLVLLPLGALRAQAAVTDFSVRAFIGNDTTPPTTPVITSAVPVAATQITITWSAATDDVQVGGYRLFRDLIQIATTSQLTFSDTGLIPGTTYSYSVDAFDIFNNFSSSSGAVATTTLVNPTPVATTSSSMSTQGSATRVLSLQNFQVTPFETSAVFSWQTNSPTQYSLTWGRTTAYELGSISGTIFNQDHRTNIDMLEPGTRYYYKLTAVDSRGIARVIEASSFTTLNKIFAETVPNVSGFSAIVRGTDVALTWRTAFTDPSIVVRVVRSHLFYPSTIQSGAVVYEGQAESFVDEEALATRSPQYYTIFVIDTNGKVSSGAIARATRSPQNIDGNNLPAPPVPGSEDLPPLVIDEGDPTLLRANDITLIQNSAVFSFSNVLTLDYQLPFVIRIPREAVAANLKTITVSLQNPSNQREVSAYLLKLNPAGEAYEALIAPSGIVGSSQILIEVFDYEQQTVRRISTQIEFVSMQLPAPFFPDQILNYMKMIVPWLLFAVLGCLAVLFLRQKMTQ